jgi:hypothetical protein
MKTDARTPCCASHELKQPHQVSVTPVLHHTGPSSTLNCYYTLRHNSGPPSHPLTSSQPANNFKFCIPSTEAPGRPLLGASDIHAVPLYTGGPGETTTSPACCLRWTQLQLGTYAVPHKLPACSCRCTPANTMLVEPNQHHTGTLNQSWDDVKPKTSSIAPRHMQHVSCEARDMY